MSKSKRFSIAISLIFVVFAIVIGGTVLMKTGNDKSIRQVQKRSLFSRVDQELLGFLVLARSKANDGQGQPSGQRTTSAKVEAVLRRNHKIIKITAKKRFKGDILLIGYLIPKGYSDRNKCAKRTFGISVGKYVLTEHEFNRLVGRFDSGSSYGNVRIEYVRDRCYLSNALSDAHADLETLLTDQILQLMPGIPPGI